MKALLQPPTRRLANLRYFFAAALLACLLGFQTQVSAAGGFMLWRQTAPKIYALPQVGMGVLAGLFFLLSFTRASGWMQKIVEFVQRVLSPLRHVNTFLFFALGALFPYLYLTRAGEMLWAYAPRIWVFGFFVLAGSILWQAARPGRDWRTSLAAALLIYAVIFRVALYIPEVSDYLFSLGWSEASRYYNASLFFSEQIYGQAYPLPTLHPTRYLLQSIPFLIPGLPLWVHRLWQVMLWLGLNGAAAWLLARRFCPRNDSLRWLAAGWAFLFFFQGPVYYHLVVCVLLVVLGFDARRFWRSLVVVALASAWAGISRINWFPLPGLLAALLYLIEVPRAKQSLLRYLLPPAAWTLLGTALAFVTQQVYIRLSGNPAEQFSSSLSSDLLWYRLWPNVTYSPGILRAILFVSLPLLVLFCAFLIRNFKSAHWLRWLGIAAVLGAFLAGGIVVSVKIGGGSNLHNLDAYLALVAVAGAAIGLGDFVADRPEKARSFRVHPILIGFILLVPAWGTILEGSPAAALPSQAEQQKALTLIQNWVDKTQVGGQQVLFINQRHLQTFGMVPEGELVADYEKVFLMEMAMGNNRAYLETFYEKLESHAFGLIVTEPLYLNFQDRTHGFSEENNVWMERVVQPILKYYRPVLTLQEFGIQLSVPID